MPHFRKKPATIEAVKVSTLFNSPAQNYPDWAWTALGNGMLIPAIDSRSMYVQTSDREVRAEYDDWVVQQENKELAVYKPDVFSALYEQIEPIG